MSNSLQPPGLKPTGSSVHGIFRVVIFYSRGSPQPRDQTRVSCFSCIGRQILYHSATWETQQINYASIFLIFKKGKRSKEGVYSNSHSIDSSERNPSIEPSGLHNSETNTEL